MRLGLRVLGKIETSLNSNSVSLRITYRHSFMMKPRSPAIDWELNPVWKGVMAASPVFANRFTRYTSHQRISLSTATSSRSKMDHQQKRRSRSPSRIIYSSYSDSYQPSDRSRSPLRDRPNSQLSHRSLSREPYFPPRSDHSTLLPNQAPKNGVPRALPNGRCPTINS